MDLREIQERFDLEKCNDSRIAGKDTCGTYDFCVCCDKDVEYPCATAKMKFAQKEEKVYYRLAVLRPVKEPESEKTFDEAEPEKVEAEEVKAEEEVEEKVEEKVEEEAAPEVEAEKVEAEEEKADEEKVEEEAVPEEEKAVVAE